MSAGKLTLKMGLVESGKIFIKIGFVDKDQTIFFHHELLKFLSHLGFGLGCHSVRY